MNDCAICFDSSEVYEGRGGDVEAEEGGELVEGFVEDLRCSIDEPDESDED